MVYSKIDQFYRSLLLTKFFTKGWGKPDNLKRIFEFRKVLSNRESCKNLVDKDHPIIIDKDYKDGDCRILEGHFKSPFVNHMPGIMPKEVETASFQAVLPLEWQDPVMKPMCIHLAGTGDHYFWRRRLFTARPLLKHAGIASILLENPFYGSRKPKNQIRSSLHNVSDLFVMGGALMLESMALLHWCERQGWGPLGISGVSMGGHMASLAATSWDNPISLVPCLSWSTASCVFTQGVMSGAIPWKVLQEQFFKNNLYHDEISKLIISPEKAYQLGQQFVINLSQELEAERDLELAVPSESVNQPVPSQQQSAQPTSNKNNINRTDNQSSTSSMSSSKTSKESSSPVLNKSIPDLDMPIFHEKTKTVTSPSSFSSSAMSDFKDQENNQKPKDQPSREGRRLTLNYAKTKQSQQSLPGNEDQKVKIRLSLGHAADKSKLLFSHRNKSGDNENPKSALNAKKRNLAEESFEFMRGVMDECTHLANFSVPVDPELVIIIAATQDAYIPREGVLPLDKLWPGSEVRYIDHGHVGAILFEQNMFRKAIVESFDRQIKKYYPQLQNIGGQSTKKQQHF